MAEIVLTKDETMKIPQVRRHESQSQQKSEDGAGRMPIDTSNLKDFTGTLKAFKRKNEEVDYESLTASNSLPGKFLYAEVFPSFTIYDTVLRKEMELNTGVCFKYMTNCLDRL